MSRATIITAPRASTLIYGMTKGAPDGPWLLPANICPAVPLALMQANTDFEFIDIDPDTLCLDTTLAERRLRQSQAPDIAGIIYVRSYGFAPTAKDDLKRLRSALNANALLVDDQCLSTPILDWDEYQPHGANAVLFSTGYSKVVDLGFGGFAAIYGPLTITPPEISPQDGALDDIMQRYKIAIERGQPLFSDPGICAGLPSWVPNAEPIGWKAMRGRIAQQLPAVLQHKARLNTIYDQGLSHLHPMADGYQNWRYTIRVKNPKEVLSALFCAGLFASDHYYPSSLLWGKGPFPQAEMLHKSVINLFNDQHFSVMQAEQAVQIIRRVAQELPIT